MNKELVSQVVARLASHGWTPIEGGTAIARKTFDTAVGPKEALVYLTNSRDDDPNRTLQGDYQSEGRNVLEPHGVLLPKAAEPVMVDALVDKFVAGAERAVGESYAARLRNQA
ncbi:hypothetical protein D3C71_25440 [compost metagenome]